MKQEPLIHLARFKFDNGGRVIGDRAFNAKSLGKNVFGDDLVEVKDDPKSFNRQLSIFKGGKFLETTVVSRSQLIDNENLFLADELSLQIYHLPQVSRIKQVETLSKYKKCNNIRIENYVFDQNSICGDQWQAVYSAPGISSNSKPVKSNHYQLILTRVAN